MSTKLTLSVLTAALIATSVPGARAETKVAVPAQPAFPKGDPGAYGQALAEYMDRYDDGWIDQYSKAAMTLYDARGDYVTRSIVQMVLEGDNGNKSLIRFLDPAEIRGVAALIHEHPDATDDSWLYLPASRRVRRISGANRTASFQGTEFTYEDLSSIVVRKYRWRYLRDDRVGAEPVYVLEAIPTFAETSYSKILVHLNQRHWRVERMEFFDKASRKLKTLAYSAWKHEHGRFWRARHLDMTNHQTKKRTVIEIQSQFVDLSRYPNRDGSARHNLDDAQFTRTALEGR